ncbi:hypothetical protein GF406_18410 [candidate division KSB1 bacterium]|nr:hypothetical protein [candidate division KSB1 bacterium]
MSVLDNKNGHHKKITDKVDYNIHGLIGVRLLQPLAGDIATVDKQLGPMRGQVQDPDITIRFVKNIPTPKLITLDVDRAGFDENGFYILQSKKRAAKVKIPFDQIGERCEIICEHGLKAVPLLIAIINLTLLKKGALALHACAFLHNDKGVLVTGWSKGGKTEALLSFAKAGADYIGDEWVILSHGGIVMYGIPEPIRIWQWHLKEYPYLRQLVSFSEKLIFKMIELFVGLDHLLQKSRWEKMVFSQALHKAIPALKRQQGTNIAPYKIFQRLCFDRGVHPDRVFLILSHQEETIQVLPISGAEIAEKMVASLQYELLPLMEYYQMFRYAFPEIDNEFLATVGKRQHDLLTKALAGKQAFSVKRPHPVSFDELFEVMDQVITTENALVA